MIIDKMLITDLPYDIKQKIFDYLPWEDKITTYRLLDQNIPTQFQISKSKLENQKGKYLKNPSQKGLIKHALLTGNIDTCVSAATLFMKKYMQDSTNNLKILEKQLRSDFKDYDEDQRVGRIELMRHGYLCT